MPMIRRTLLGAATGLAMALAAPGLAAGAVSPETFIADLGARAIAVLERKDLDMQEREWELGRLLADGFDMGYLARIVLGRPYRELSEEQRAEYQQLFREFVLKTYSARLSNYAGEELAVLRAVPVGNDEDIQVSSEIRRVGEPPLRIDWRLRPQDGGYRIIDVIVEQVSLVVTQRGEFQSIVAQQGIGGLLTTLRARAERASAEPPRSG
jgi:phospholipid transport system substrate-binding protein